MLAQFAAAFEADGGELGEVNMVDFNEGEVKLTFAEVTLILFSLYLSCSNCKFSGSESTSCYCFLFFFALFFTLLCSTMLWIVYSSG